MKFSYKSCSLGYEILINKKPFLSPGGNSIFIPDYEFVKNILNFLNKKIKEGKGQKNQFSRMLFFSADNILNNLEEIKKKITNYNVTDTILYRAKKESKFERIQAKEWDPLVDYAEKKLGLAKRLQYGVMPLKANKNNIKIIKKNICKFNIYEICSLYFLLQHTNSLIISLCLIRENINMEEAFYKAHLEFYYNQEFFAKDESLEKKLLLKKKEFIDIIEFSKHLKFNWSL